MKSNGNSVDGEFPFINFISNRCLVGFFFYKEMIACYPGVGEELVDLKIA